MYISLASLRYVVLQELLLCIASMFMTLASLSSPLRIASHTASLSPSSSAGHTQRINAGLVQNCAGNQRVRKAPGTRTCRQSPSPALQRCLSPRKRAKEVRPRSTTLRPPRHRPWVCSSVSLLLGAHKHSVHSNDAGSTALYLAAASGSAYISIHTRTRAGTHTHQPGKDSRRPPLPLTLNSCKRFPSAA